MSPSQPSACWAVPMAAVVEVLMVERELSDVSMMREMLSVRLPAWWAAFDKPDAMAGDGVVCGSAASWRVAAGWKPLE